MQGCKLLPKLSKQMNTDIKTPTQKSERKAALKNAFKEVYTQIENLRQKAIEIGRIDLFNLIDEIDLKVYDIELETEEEESEPTIKTKFISLYEEIKKLEGLNKLFLITDTII